MKNNAEDMKSLLEYDIEVIIDAAHRLAKWSYIQGYAHGKRVAGESAGNDDLTAIQDRWHFDIRDFIDDTLRKDTYTMKNNEK